jgi:hypothetical protein
MYPSVNIGIMENITDIAANQQRTEYEMEIIKEEFGSYGKLG